MTNSRPASDGRYKARKTTSANSFDDNELSEWKNDGRPSTAWISYRLERKARIDEVCMKLTGWRMRSYPIEPSQPQGAARNRQPLIFCQNIDYDPTNGQINIGLLKKSI